MKTLRPLLAAALAATCLARLSATLPSDRPTDKSDNRAVEFVPTGGYVRTVLKQRLRRQAAQRNLTPSTTGAPRAISGVRKLPVICLQFSNRSFPHPVSAYQNLLFNPTPGEKTMTQYFRDASRGLLTVTGQAFGWYSLPKEDTYYENNAHGNGAPFGEMLEFGLREADQQIDFGEFDNDGPDGVPNSGDDDGKVDTVMFIHPETGAEIDEVTDSGNIWSHAWHYSAPEYGRGGPYRTRAIQRDANGQPRLGPGGAPLPITVDDYVIQPGLADFDGRIVEIGVFCHEFGHALGLPDLYDRTPDNPNSYGAGNWCLMAYGGNGFKRSENDRTSAETPVFMSAWCREFLGWAQVEQVGAGGSLRFRDRHHVYRVDVPRPDRKEYFLLEYRNPNWQPGPGEVNWDARLPIAGIAIWHVDNAVGEKVGNLPNPYWPFSPNDAGQNDAPSLPDGTTFGPKHALVALVEADRQLHLARSDNKGDSGDLWLPAAAFGDDPTLIAGSRSYDGQGTGISLGGFEVLAMAVPPTAVAANAPSPAAAADSGRPAAPGRSRAAGAALSGIARVDQQLTDFARQRVGTNLTGASRQGLLADSRQAVQPVKSNETVTQVSRELARTGAATLALPDLAVIKAAPAWEIDLSTNVETRQAIKAIGAESRTVELKSGAPASNLSRLEQSLQSIIGEMPKNSTMQMQVAPDPGRFSRLTGLALPVKGGTVTQDAQNRLGQDFRVGVGELSNWTVQSPGKESAQGVVKFDQTVKVGNKALPVFGAVATFYYNTKGAAPKLTAVDNQGVDLAQVKVAGRTGRMTSAEIRQLLSSELGLVAESIQVGREGVYLENGDPGKGTVTTEVTVQIGEGHEPLRVYVDANNRKVVSVE